MRARLLLLALLGAGLAGCASRLHPKRPGDRADGISQDKARGAQGGFWRKQVSGKAEPATLVAVDGSVCSVTAKRFKETMTGEKVWCGWRVGSR
jgi:hypothetical protein